jgi:hypothetical protein
MPGVVVEHFASQASVLAAPVADHDKQALPVCLSFRFLGTRHPASKHLNQSIWCVHGVQIPAIG